jgi:hypothetical protein
VLGRKSGIDPFYTHLPLQLADVSELFTWMKEKQIKLLGGLLLQPLSLSTVQPRVGSFVVLRF